MRILLIIATLIIPYSSFAAPKEVPYYASIKSGEANVRTGPSVRYPIQWVYRKPNWPVEVTATFENWRKIKDIHGEVGWIHESLITGKRNVVVNANGVQEIYRLPILTSAVVVIVENGVLAELVSCKSQWCKIKLDKRKGWIEAKYLWGLEDG